VKIIAPLLPDTPFSRYLFTLRNLLPMKEDYLALGFQKIHNGMIAAKFQKIVFVDVGSRS
jgi:hypothetical protein